MSTLHHPTPLLLQAFQEGDLSAPALAHWGRHLERCPDCAAELARLVALDAALEASNAQSVPFDFAAGVMARIATEPALPEMRATWTWPTDSLAPLLIGLVGAVVLVMQLHGILLTIEGIHAPLLYAGIAVAILALAPVVSGVRGIREH